MAEEAEVGLRSLLGGGGGVEARDRGAGGGGGAKGELKQDDLTSDITYHWKFPFSR